MSTTATSARTRARSARRLAERRVRTPRRPPIEASSNVFADVRPVGRIRTGGPVAFICSKTAPRPRRAVDGAIANSPSPPSRDVTARRGTRGRDRARARERAFVPRRGLPRCGRALSALTARRERAGRMRARQCPRLRRRTSRASAPPAPARGAAVRAPLGRAAWRDDALVAPIPGSPRLLQTEAYHAPGRGARQHRRPRQRRRSVRREGLLAALAAAVAELEASLLCLLRSSR